MLNVILFGVCITCGWVFGLCLLLLIFVVRFPVWACRGPALLGNFYSIFGAFLITIWSGFGFLGVCCLFDLLRV